MRRGRAGFTLVELMVVCVVVGIMTAMILPEMLGTMEEARLRSSARKMISVFQLARSRAIITREPHRVRFDVEGRKYQLEARGASGQGRGGYAATGISLGSGGELDPRIEIAIRRSRGSEESVSADVVSPGATAGGAHEAEGVDAITFYADGTADAGEMMLRDRHGFGLGLRVDHATGRVELKELGRE
jgi:type II secretion system protein H